MRSPVAIGAEPSKQWTVTAAAEPLGPLPPTHLLEQGDDRSLALYRGAGSSLGDCGTRSIEGDAPCRNEFDLHIRGIDASLLELLPQPVCPGQRRRTLHVDDDHVAAGGDVARGPADLITERTCCGQRLGFACGVATGGDGCRGQGDTNGNYQCSDGKYCRASVEGPPFGSSCGAIRRWKP